ncbi:MAG: 1-(5-phosphoribosyl)-5-[(5-phosphoribosylamino)methylideneamino]imidazole-4-carboxamide isomerase [Bacteroidia bacterium]
MITLIPAIDIILGRCVRLTEGDYDQQTVYAEDPAVVAKRFESVGIKRVHLVDLDGAKIGRVSNLAVLEQVAKSTNLTIDFGGGIKTEDDLKRIWDAGAAMVSIGSMAVKQPEVFASWVEKYGPEKFFLGADVRDRKISINAWTEQTEEDVVDFIQRHQQKKITQFFCTDIGRDGRLEGPAFDLYKHIIAQCPQAEITASGGVSSVEDIRSLQKLGCNGVIIGKALYEGRIHLEQLNEFLGTSI